MKLLNHNDQEFLIAHFQGSSLDEHSKLLVPEFAKRKIIIPKDISVVTVATKNIVERSPLIYQLNKNKIPYINTAAEHDPIFEGWTNTEKPKYILSGLAQVQTKYALVLDGNDVLFTGSLKNIVGIFNEYETEVLFGATKNNYPNVVIDKVDKRDWFGEFKYLNAGTAFGYTDSLIKFYELVQQKIQELDDGNPSEQYYVRHVFADNQNWSFFDYKTSIFQTFSKTEVFHPNIDDVSVAKVV